MGLDGRDFNAQTMITEGRNPATLDIDACDTHEILHRMHAEDRKVADAVAREIPQIARAVDMIVAALKGGGRLFYIGAGTSGRLGILDASECPPTFGTDPDLVQGIIAGGLQAVTRSVEGAEDDPDQGVQDLSAFGFSGRDVLVGIAASGRTPYVLGAMQEARSIGAAVIALVCNPDSPMAAAADISISPVVGPEVIMGSTRMKAGTAQKLALNMLSTAAMIRMGKVYSNLMVDLKASNSKLVHRARRVVGMAAGVDDATAARVYSLAGGDVKVAIVCARTTVDADAARTVLQQAQGDVRTAIELVGKG